MKTNKIFKLAFLLLCTLSTYLVHAQTQIQIGTGTNSPSSTLYHPVYRFSATSTTLDCKSNVIYTAAELSAAGINNGDIITALSYNKLNTANFVTPATYTILMANTNNTAPLAGTIATQWPTILTTHSVVYTSTSFNMPNTTGWMTINLQTPFVYTGGAIEIATDLLMGGSGAATDAFKFQYTTGFSGYVIGATSGNSNLATYKERPNIKFTVQSGATCNASPNAGTAVSTITEGCLNASINLTLTGHSTGSGITYTWQESIDNINFVDVSTANLVPAYATTLTATKWYRCKVVCNNQTPSYSTPVQVSLINVDINVSNDQIVLCGPGTATFIASSSVSNAIFKWYSNATLTTLLATGSSYITPNLINNTKYYVIAEHPTSGCRSAVKEVEVIVGGDIELDLGPDINVCLEEGEYVYLNARNPGVDYLWDNGYNGQVRAINQSGTYWVELTSSNNCSTSDTISITIKSKPNVNLGNDTTICDGTQLTLDAGDNGVDYIWNNGVTTRYNHINNSNYSEYIVTVTGSNGCQNSDTININYNGLSPYNDAIMVRNITNNRFKFEVVNPQNVLTYEWNFGDGNVSYMASPTHTFPNSGNYIVTLTSYSKCGENIDTVTVHIKGLSIDEISKNLLTLYPNPADAYIKLDFNSEVGAIEQYEIYNLAGQIVKSEVVNKSNIDKINVSDLNNGMYLIRFKTQNYHQLMATFSINR
jgi:hypothetical protein